MDRGQIPAATIAVSYLGAGVGAGSSQVSAGKHTRLGSDLLYVPGAAVVVYVINGVIRGAQAMLVHIGDGRIVAGVKSDGGMARVGPGSVVYGGK